MRLRYTKRAAAELDSILVSIKMASPRGAISVQKRLQDTFLLLLRYPLAGRLTDKRQLRRIVALPYPYVIFYRTSATEVIIHGIRHTARRPVAPTQS